MTAPATIVTSLYGTGYHHFAQTWARSIRHLNTEPEAVIIATDQPIPLDRHDPLQGVDVHVTQSRWRHPQAYYLHQAIMMARSEWVWILDIDDTALPDALDGIQNVQADVWQMGFERSDGETHIPPQFTASEYLAATGNPFTAGSAIWRDAFLDCGGFPDVAFQDYGLWRRLAWIGASFLSSGRAHYRYNLHAHTRSVLELVPDRREENLAEMMESEVAHVH